jgi:hypothetical protein
VSVCFLCLCLLLRNVSVCFLCLCLLLRNVSVCFLCLCLLLRNVSVCFLCLCLLLRNVMSGTIMTIFVDYFTRCFALLYNPTSRHWNSVRQMASRGQIYPDVAFIDRSKKCFSYADQGPFHVHFSVRVILIIADLTVTVKYMKSKNYRMSEHFNNSKIQPYK